MPYTLTKGLVWVLLAVLLGMLIGWLLRSVAAKRQLERVRSDANDESELVRLRTRVANLEPIVNERDRLKIELDAARATAATATPAQAGGDAVPAGAGSSEGESTADDLARAEAALGRAIVVDDLTVIVGIDPEVAELCRGIGIRTWAELAVTEVSLLRTMLTDAGRPPSEHDPTSWPDQARLLAGRAWSAYSDRIAELADVDRGVD